MHLIFFENTHHESLDHDTRDALYAHHEYSLGALFGSGTAAVSNGVLRLNTEEKAAGEAKDIIDARRPIVLHLKGWQVMLFEVTVGESDQPPNHREA